MPALLCTQCSAPLSLDAARGLAPCGSCGVINAPPADTPAPFPFTEASSSRPPSPGAPPVVCPECRHENPARYKFCLGCGRELHGGASRE